MNSKSVVRFKSSVAVVDLGNSMLELFETNERRAKRISMSAQEAISIIQLLDGEKTVEEICKEVAVYHDKDVVTFIRFLVNEYFAIEVDEGYPTSMLFKYKRLLNFLEAHSTKTSAVIRQLEALQSSVVLIIGCGGVGSWVAKGLATAGVREICIMDDDIIEASNLNRQTGFGISDIGKYKVEVLAKKLSSAFGVGVRPILGKVRSTQDIEQLERRFKLVVNCADEPSVDFTSLIVADYCMNNDIAHIIGGGYNLHLTLAGQLIVPGKTACFKCFDNYFSNVNDPELFGFKKLNRKRKIGSFGALCSFTASLAINNSLRYLAGIRFDNINGTNRRYEFSLSSMELSATQIGEGHRCGECGWAG